MIATSVLSSTLREDRSRIVVALSPDGYTAELIAASNQFVLHLISEAKIDLVRHFGLRSGREVDKLAGMELARSSDGIPIVPGMCGHSECEVIGTMETPDRLVLLATGRRHQISKDLAPLTLNTLYRDAPKHVVEAIEAQRKRDAEKDRS